MGKRSMVVTSGMVLCLFTSHGIAFAHGAEKHDKMVPADAQMKILHAMMPMFSLVCANMETGLEKGEIAIIESEAEKITAAIPDLKKSKPHKNLKQQSRYVDHVSSLEKAVITTVDLAKKGDLVEAKAAYKKVEAACAACHAKFCD